VKKAMMHLRFRTRLALVMFLTMTMASAILTWAHFQHRRQLMLYVSAETEYLLTISQLTQQKLPTNVKPEEAVKTYMEAMKAAGLSSVNIATPTGEVVASTNPGQVGKKIPLKRPRLVAKPGPVTISAVLKDLDPQMIEQRPYVIQFPIVQGDKVIAYAQVHGEADEVEVLLKRWYKQRLYSILATMLAGMLAIVYLGFLFTKPVDMLVEGAQQVAKGNLFVSLPATGSDEMGRLAQTFNQMVERLREHRALQERLNEAEKLSLLGRFSATVAHEVRNSLNFINLSIDQIRAKHSNGDERASRELQRNLDNIKDEISRLNRLVNDFLTAGRQMPPEMGPCDLTTIIREALSLVEKQARRQSISLALDLPADLPPFRLDAAQIKTCFLNILTNAIQAMPRGGQIHISALNLPARFDSAHRPDGSTPLPSTSLREAEQGRSLTAPEQGRRELVEGQAGLLQPAAAGGVVQLRFADTGPGIPAEDRQKVFTPFYSTKATGFGLGLAITKKIVEDHGGRVYVGENNTPGVAPHPTRQGTVIIVELPLPRTMAPQPSALAATPAR
jgi:signal transduction histidine kinase